MKTALAAAALGLPSALLAHALVFGNDHAAGGALQSAVLAFAALALVLCVSLRAARLAQGSVVARRMLDCVPHAATLAAASGAWFGIIELCESPHAIPPLAVAAAIAIACFVIIAALRGTARCIATIALAVITALREFVIPALPAADIAFALAPASLPLARTHRLFSRPPPALS
ncbi:MAG TPA: hypothetical protein VFL13_03390 [Candidatus Baltobacteraceae bacterium]|nr:hypothetical protein [Candidatus Baltobacteraceae bacterium]